jgi:hypothetical protein
LKVLLTKIFLIILHNYKKKDGKPIKIALFELFNFRLVFPVFLASSPTF